MFSDTPLVMVEDSATLEQVAATLRTARVVGVDTESDSMYHYRERVCLIQFSDLERDYIVDTVKVTDLSPLTPLFADPSIVKVLHGADYDVVCLRRDFDFQILGMFDTLIAAQMLGLERIGLADLLERFFGLDIDKKFQRHDWSRRPLLPEHLEYARGDTHYLLALRELMMRKLQQVDRVAHLEEECAILEQRQWNGHTDFDPDGYLRMKGIQKLDDTALRVLKRLWIYRDGEARKLNRPQYKVFPNSAMIDLARKRPANQGQLDKLFARQTAMRRRHSSGMLKAVRLGLEDDFPIPKAPRRRGGSTTTTSGKARLNGRAAERAFDALKDWRNATSKGKSVNFTIVANGTLRNIARACPRTLEELAEVDEVRQWQVRDHGEAILAVLQKAAP